MRVQFSRIDFLTQKPIMRMLCNIPELITIYLSSYTAGCGEFLQSCHLSFRENFERCCLGRAGKLVRKKTMF